MSKELKVGIFAVVSGVILYFGFSFLKGNDFFSTSNKFYAVFGTIDGLNVSNPVIVNGYEIGRVSGIQILQKQDNKILVELMVKGEVIIGKGAQATLVNSDFLGSKAIILDVGDINNPMESGDTVSADIDKGLAAILDRAQPLTDNLGVTISRLNEILLGMEGAGEQLTTVLTTANKTMISLKYFMDENRSVIKSTVSNMDTLMVSLNGTVKKINPLLENANGTFDKINNLPLDSTVVTLNGTLLELRQLMESLNAGEGSMGKILKEDSLHTNLNQMLLDLDKLLIHFNENPKHFMGPLGKSKKQIEKDQAKK